MIIFCGVKKIGCFKKENNVHESDGVSKPEWVQFLMDTDLTGWTINKYLAPSH